MPIRNEHGKKLAKGGVAFSIAIASVFVAGGSLITQASAAELSTGVPATALAPALPPSASWIVGPPLNGINLDAGMATTPAAVQGLMTSDPSYSNPGGGEKMGLLALPESPTVLAGDDVTFISGAWAVQGAGAVGTGGTYTAPPAGNWVPMSQFIIFRDTNTGLASSDIEFPSWPTNCASNPPSVDSGHSVTVWDGWCVGAPGVFRFTIDKITAPDGLDPIRPYQRWWNITPNAGIVAAGAVDFGGPNNPRTGSTSTTYGQVEVLDPRLQVIKEVCATGTGCDPTAVIGDNTPVPDTMPNTTGQWIDASLLPVGVTDIQWRITANNTGNVTLDNVHIANDSWGYTNSGDAGKVDVSSCETHVFGTLAPGASSSWDCTTSVTGSLKGDIVNGVNLNGSVAPDPRVPGGFVSPDGSNISVRLQGNPEPGSTGAGFVGSNTDIARASMPAPGLKLTKWVCETGTGCAIPTGDTLRTLAGYTVAGVVVQGQPAGGWVKETTVADGIQVDWLMVVTNTGNTYMENVTLNLERTVDNASGAVVQTDLAFSPTSVAVLKPGESTVFTASTPSVTNTNPYVTGDNGVIDAATGEPVYESGSDVVNIAQAQGDPTLDGKGTPVFGSSGNPITDFPTNQSSAEVNTVVVVTSVYTGGMLLPNAPASGQALLVLLGFGIVSVAFKKVAVR